MNKSEEIRRFISAKIDEARVRGEDFVILVSGDIHRELKLNNSMPSVCDAMYRLRGPMDEILHTTPSGKSSTISIKYYFGKRNEPFSVPPKSSLVRRILLKLKSKTPTNSGEGFA
ncbi:MAG: hypothetical protein WCJ89_09065 [Actinomycetes bacterium]